jgi:hypothetical protein
MECATPFHEMSCSSFAEGELYDRVVEFRDECAELVIADC